MSLAPFPVPGFGGLDLRTDPLQVGPTGCIDCDDVTIEPGLVRSRDGLTALWTVTGTNPLPSFLYRHAAGVLIVAADGTNVLWALLSSGTTFSTSVTDAKSFAAATIGTPSNTYSYVGNNDGVRRWDGSAWSTPGAPAATRALAVTPWDNRLVTAPSSGSGCRVNFSDAGAPETFGANNFNELEPGDGDVIRGMGVFNNQLFVFKRTKFYVFYGTSTSGTGDPIFDYRTVNTGVGLASSDQAITSQAAVATGPEGLYFIGTKGVYVTRGGAPQLISQAIEPVFHGDAHPYYSGGQVHLLTSYDSRLHWHNDTLHVLLSDGSDPPIHLVWDRRLDAWTRWTADINALASWERDSATTTDLVAAVNTAGKVMVVDPAAATDDSAAINASYRSGFYDMGKPGQEKTIRETVLTGTGNVGYQLSRDGGALDTVRTVTLGTSPVPARGWDRQGKNGELFSHQLSSVSGGAFRVNALEHQVGNIRPAGMKSTL